MRDGKYGVLGRFDMVIDIRVTATSQTIEVKSQAATYNLTLPNSLLFDVAEKKLYGVGRTEEILRQESPEAWVNRPDTMQFMPIYDAYHFQPLMTYVALYFLRQAVYYETRSILAQLMLGRFDRFVYTLYLPNYESIIRELRYQFEREFRYHQKRAVKQLVINDNQIS